MQGYTIILRVELMQKYHNQKMINSQTGLTVRKCESMSFHQRQYDTMNNSFTYKINGVPLEQVKSRILKSCLILYYCFINILAIVVSKAYSMLRLMQKNFQELSRESRLLFCKRTWKDHIRNMLRDINFQEFHFSRAEFLFLGLDKYSTDLSRSAKVTPAAAAARMHKAHHRCLPTGIHFMLQTLGSGRGKERYTRNVTVGVACCMEDTEGGRCEWPVSKHSPSIKWHLTEADFFILHTGDWSMLVAKLAVGFPAAQWNLLIWVTGE